MKKHIVITGKVQGVGFRYWLHKAAVRKNINGRVLWEISGEVEALLIGDDVEIDKANSLNLSGNNNMFFHIKC
jgi:acylphosphatase